MADKEINPKDPQATEVADNSDERDEAERTDKTASKTSSRKVGRAYSSSDRNLKDNVVLVTW